MLLLPFVLPHAAPPVHVLGTTPAMTNTSVPRIVSWPLTVAAVLAASRLLSLSPEGAG
jgi:hypothetical protein